MSRSYRLSCTFLLILLAGCGFQLRGSLDLPPAWQDLYLNSSSPNSELSRSLRDRAESAGIRWLDADQANYRIYLGNEKFQQRNLTIGQNARAAEIELQMSTTMRVTDSQGTELMPETEVQTFRVIINDPNNISSTTEEARLFREEMRQELVQQLLRKLKFLSTGTV